MNHLAVTPVVKFDHQEAALLHFPGARIHGAVNDSIHPEIFYPDLGSPARWAIDTS